MATNKPVGSPCKSLSKGNVEETAAKEAVKGARGDKDVVDGEGE